MTFFSGESASERWNPTQSVESILISVLSLLSDPNTSSPANVDAGVMYRNDRDGYMKKVQQQVLDSKKNIPEDMIVPTSGNLGFKFKLLLVSDFVFKKHESDIEEDEDFWVESEEDYEEEEEDGMMESDDDS